MFKSSSVMRLLIGLLLLVSVVSCGQNQQSVQQTAPAQVKKEDPAPDYTAIREALKDPSTLVRSQAINNLRIYTHSSVVDEYLNALLANIDNPTLSALCIRALGKQGDKAIPRVREVLWDDKSLSLQAIGLDLLSILEKPENFYPDVVNRYYETPYDSGAFRYREKMVDYIAKNTSKDNLEAVADLVVMLKDKDPKIVETVTKALSKLKSKEVQDQIITVYENDPENEKVVLSVLTVLNSYGVPTKENPVPVKDLKVYMHTFGSYNKDIQNQSYIGMNTFAYNDKDGKIMNYLKSFQNCDYDLVRSHLVSLMQKVPNKTYPEGQEPTFSFPKGNRQGYCH